MGLNLTQQSNVITISGTPTATNAFAAPLTLTVTARDSVGDTATVQYPISVFYTPQQISEAYGLNMITLSGGITGTGAGQTVAIIEDGDAPNFVSTSDPNFANSDLHEFDLALGLPDPPSFTKVNEFGGTDLPPVSASAEHEYTQDVEWVHARAPQASIIVVEFGLSIFDAEATARTTPQRHGGVG